MLKKKGGGGLKVIYNFHTRTTKNWFELTGSWKVRQCYYFLCQGGLVILCFTRFKPMILINWFTKGKTMLLFPLSRASHHPTLDQTQPCGGGWVLQMQTLKSTLLGTWCYHGCFFKLGVGQITAILLDQWMCNHTTSQRLARLLC